MRTFRETMTLYFPEYRNAALRLELDAREIFPDDPGLGTPAMVYVGVREMQWGGTYHCALGEGELIWIGAGTVHATREISDRESRWLESNGELVDDFITYHTSKKV